MIMLHTHLFSHLSHKEEYNLVNSNVLITFMFVICSSQV